MGTNHSQPTDPSTVQPLPHEQRQHHQQQQNEQEGKQQQNQIDRTFSTASTLKPHQNNLSSRDPLYSGSHPQSQSQSQEKENEEMVADRKPSFYRRYQDRKAGRHVRYTDEQLVAATGKTREELKAWAEGREGVGGRQQSGEAANVMGLKGMGGDG